MQRLRMARMNHFTMFLIATLLIMITFSACVPRMLGGMSDEGEESVIGDEGSGNEPGHGDGGNGNESGDADEGEPGSEDGGNENTPGNGDGAETVSLVLPIENANDLGWRAGGESYFQLNVGSVNIWFGGAFASYDTDAFFRWRDVPIERGATITKAYMTMVNSTPDPGDQSLNRHPVQVNIVAFATDHLPDFRQVRNIHEDTADLPRTTAHVIWDIDESWRSNEWIERDTPDIKEVIQEVVDRPGWSKGNSLGIAFDSQELTGRDRYHREICAFNDNFGRCPTVGGQPVLYVEYVK